MSNLNLKCRIIEMCNSVLTCDMMLKSESELDNVIV
jgi:hypothetical protein